MRIISIHSTRNERAAAAILKFTSVFNENRKTSSQAEEFVHKSIVHSERDSSKVTCIDDLLIIIQELLK